MLMKSFLQQSQETMPIRSRIGIQKEKESCHTICGREGNSY